MSRMKGLDEFVNESMSNLSKNLRKMSDEMIRLGHFPPREHSEKIEFLSRQHVDFKTTEGIKKLIQAVTWRAKVEIGINYASIYVRKKRIPDVRRLADEFGISGSKYEVKEIGWFKCWFKRFQIVEIKPNEPKVFHASNVKMTINGVPVMSWGYDPAKDGDNSAEATFEKKQDGSFELISMEIEKNGPIPKFISKGQGKTSTQGISYFVEDPESILEIDKKIILNGKFYKVKRIVRKEGNPLTRITGNFI